MLAHLRNGRAIELSQTEYNICTLDDFKGTFPGLYNRGLIDTKSVLFDGEKKFCVYITKSGINFLNEYREGGKKSGTEYIQIKHLFYQLGHSIKFW